MSCQGQEPNLSYRLKQGNRYSLDISVQQNTFSENSTRENEVSLDLKMIIHFDIISQTGHDTYIAEARYDNIFLSMFAPAMKIDLNSKAGKNSMLGAMIDSLEKKSFKIQLNGDGSFIMYGDINKFFYDMYDFDISGEEERDVIIKTLKEAFGNNAFQSICNIFINIYPSLPGMKHWEKEFTYYFNTKPVKMINRFFLMKQTDNQLTIQGLGMISAEEYFMESRNNTTYSSSATGSQTYDLLIDPETGWLKSAASRQRILIKTTIIKDSQLPSGLAIPSYTETTFNIKGKIEN